MRTGGRKARRSVRRRRAIRNLAGFVNRDGSRKVTSIESRVASILDSAGLYYVPEKEMFWKGKRRIFDFWVTDGLNYSLLIECDGDYFHANAYKEGSVPRSKLTRLQKRNVRNDEFKDRMAQAKGVPLLRLTESEIKRDGAGVRDKILAAVRAMHPAFGE